MQKNLINLALCCAMALLQFGCTSVLFIDTTKPAEVAVVNEQWKVGIINRYNSSLLPFNKEKKVHVFEDGAQYALIGAVDAILQDETYDLVFTDSASYKTQNPMQPLSPEQVLEIYKQHPHHLLLSLEDFTAFLEQETVREQDTDGSVSKTAHYTLVTKSTWMLYDSTGTVLDKVTLKQNELYQSRGVISGLLAIGPALGNAGPAINDLAWRTGNMYWKRLSPQQVTFTRSYYSMKELEPAAMKMAAGDWQSAIALLKPMAEESGKKESAKAAYNLAVVYEAMGDIEKAKYWAQEASKKKDKLATQLLPNLEHGY